MCNKCKSIKMKKKNCQKKQKSAYVKCFKFHFSQDKFVALIQSYSIIVSIKSLENCMYGQECSPVQVCITENQKASMTENTLFNHCTVERMFHFSLL